jgi:hypothetical protein
MAVWLDDELAGMTPLDAWLRPGVHRVVWAPAQGDVYMPPVTRSVAVGAADDTVVTCRADDILHLTSEPFDALVERDGAPAGRTPMWLDLGVEAARVRVSAPGRLPVTLAADSLRTVEGSLRVVLPRTAALRAGSGWGPDRHRGWWRPAAFLLSAAASWAAIDLKDRADASYRDYLRTGEPAERDRRFDMAVRYDRWSVAAWVAAGAAWSGFLWTMMREEPREVVRWDGE